MIETGILLGAGMLIFEGAFISAARIPIKPISTHVVIITACGINQILVAAHRGKLTVARWKRVERTARLRALYMDDASPQRIDIGCAGSPTNERS